MKKHENLNQGYGESRGQSRCITYSSNLSYCPHCGKFTERATATGQVSGYSISHGTATVKNHHSPLQNNQELNNDEG